MNATNKINFADFFDKEEILEGYVWDSNSQYPKILRNQSFDFSSYQENEDAYIVEALLYSNLKKCSWIIKHTGTYQITKFDLSKLDPNYQLVPVDYLPHRLKKNNPAGATLIERVCFQQLWIPEEDPNCEDMEVLKMQALIFTGFNNQQKLA